MHLSTNGLFILLFVLIAFSIFFSLAETAMMSLNRYRLHHLAKQNHSLAKLVYELIQRPDRLLGIILFCDTFADILASAIATLIAVHLFGEKSVLLATVSLTLIVLIFGEVAPKTLAALYPQQIAFIAAWPLWILLRILYPLIWFINLVANGTLRLFGVRVSEARADQLSHEELRTVVHEASGRLSLDYQAMLVKTLDLGKVTVEDIMVPRNEIIGIDITSDWHNIVEQLTNSQHTRLPVYEQSINNVIGLVHLRKVLNLLAEEKLTKETLIEIAEDIYFVPESTPLNIQLLNFRQEKKRSGLVVNEYGDIQGLVTLEDILEEIVGEFTTDIAHFTSKAIHPQADGSYIIDGSVTLRELNQTLKTYFPTEGPKTLNGLIIEYLENIPGNNLCLRLYGTAMEILQTKDNIIKAVRIYPQKPVKKNND